MREQFRSQLRHRECAAFNAMMELNPFSASDAELAGAIADYMVARAKLLRENYNMTFCVILESRRATCALPFDWKRKNMWGIRTKDEARARQWCLDALLGDYHLDLYSGAWNLNSFRKRQQEIWNESLGLPPVPATLDEKPAAAFRRLVELRPAG